MKRLIRFFFLGFLLGYFFNPAFAAEVVIPDVRLKAAIWQTLGRALPVGTVTAEDMLSLTNLDASFKGVESIDGLGAAHNLTTLYLHFNRLTSLTLPEGLTNLTVLILTGNQLTSLTLPPGLMSLTELYLGYNPLKSLTLPTGLASLAYLNLYYTQLEDFSFLTGLTNLNALSLVGYQATSLTLPAGLTSLGELDISNSQLTSLTLPADLTSLTRLDLSQGQPSLSLTLPAGLTNLTAVDLSGLASLTLFTGLTRLPSFDIDIPPFRHLTISKALADSYFKGTVETFRSLGVEITLMMPPPTLATGSLNSFGVFDFVLSGSPGEYQIQVTRDLATWTDLDSVTIPQSGSVTVTDPAAKSKAMGFYRAVQSN